jgi:AcrR family transcriptional regulator
MARVAEMRAPAEPSSTLQRAKYVRMLEAAAELGGAKDLDRVQMHELAKLAGVAIGTVYRYFPSKTHLFVAVMVSKFDQLNAAVPTRQAPSGQPADAIAETLVRVLHVLMRRPLLATSMIHSVITANVSTVVEVGEVDSQIRRALLVAARLNEPTEEDLVVIRLVIQQWYGVIQSCLNGHIDIARAESDLRMGCRLLLVHVSSDTSRHSVDETGPRSSAEHP